jgi:hypothetical protein
LVTPETLEAALEATALAAEQSIRNGDVPGLMEAIARGVKWQPEPFTDGEHFDLPDQVMGRGWGDCDDLAPWLAGELRATGEDPDARPRVYKSGPDRWHVVVQTSDGQILDPSKWAGMGAKKSQVSGYGGVRGAIAKPFARPGEGAIAVMPRHGRFWARCDVPYPDSCAHLASHARAMDPDTAIERAVAGAIACGDVLGVDVDPHVLAGSMLLGDADEAMSIGFLPLLAALAPSLLPAGVSMAKNLFGGGKKKGAPPPPPPDALRHPDGAVSMPAVVPGSGGRDDLRMMLSYYPTHAQGPVVMRF